MSHSPRGGPGGPAGGWASGEPPPASDGRGAEVLVRRVPATEHVDTVTQIHAASAANAYRHIFPAPFPYASARARWARFGGEMLLAYHEDRPVDFLAADGDTVEALYVVPDAWGRGVGTVLLTAAPTTRRLWVLEGNRAGRTFYERRGWRWSGTARPAGDADGVSELLYVREPRPGS